MQAYPDIENFIKNPLPYIIQKLDKLTERKNLSYKINLKILERVLENPDGLIHKIGEIKD